MKMKKHLKFISLSFLVVLLFTACGKKLTYETISAGTEKDALLKEMNKKPLERVDESGNCFLTFEKCPYLTYKGTATYCLADNKVMFARWEYTSEDQTKSKAVYDAIRAEKVRSYGDAQESTSEDIYMSVWTRNTDSITLTCIPEENNQVKVCLTEIVESGAAQ